MTLPWTELPNRPSGRTRDELLAHVVHRGHRLRRRRQAARAVAGAALVAVAGLLLVQVTPDNKEQGVVAGPPSGGETTVDTAGADGTAETPSTVVPDPTSTSTAN